MFGGWQSTAAIISERGVQWLVGALLYSPLLWLVDSPSIVGDYLPRWAWIPLATISILWYMTKGHFPGFMMGTESREYIDEQIKNGRTIPFEKLVDRIANYRGYEKFGINWCFVQLCFCKIGYAVVPALLVGWEFMLVGWATAMTYPAMFYVKPKSVANFLGGPTSWAEFWQGWYIAIALYC